MIHEILKILDTTDIPELEKQRITTDLLSLFIVGRSELLRDYFAWHKEKGFVSHKPSDIDEFLSKHYR
jgi:hypothetical protein